MRTIDPILAAAMREGRGEPIARARLYDYDGTAFIYQGSVDLDSYEMRGQTCVCTSRSLLSGAAFTVERGVQIAGIEYVQESQYFFVTKSERGNGLYEISGHFLPAGIVSSSRSADVSAQSFCSSILGDFALTLSVSSAEAWHGWQFYPFGVALQLTPSGLKNLLNRKYRAEMYPRKGGQICVYSPSLYSLGSPVDVVLSGAKRVSEASRGFTLVWADELDVRHEYNYVAPSEFVIDIGFVPSSVALSAVGKLAYVQGAGIVWVGRPDLALEEGDFIRVVVDGITTNTVITLIEKFNRSASSPVWQQVIIRSELARSASASSLSGGLISSMHGSALLDTSSFDGNLDSTVSTVQALAERVDDLPLAPATTAANDVQVGDGAGNWIKKTLAEFVTIIRTVLDSVYLFVNGWTSSSATWSYSSLDSGGLTGVISVNADMTSLIGVGDRITYVQSSTTKYGIVTKVGAYSGGATLITFFYGNNTAFANAAITSPKYSHAKSPFGFPTDPAQWTVLVTDTTDRSQANPTAGAYYQPGSLSITVPIGVWKLGFIAVLSCSKANAQISMQILLSTTTNSITDGQLVGYQIGYGTTVVRTQQNVFRPITLASKTTYNVLVYTGTSGVTDISILPSSGATTKIYAECALL